MAGAGSVSFDRPRRQLAADPAPPAGREPDAAGRDGDGPRHDGGDRRTEVVPGADAGVQAGRVDGDQVGDRVGPERRERPPEPDGGGHGQRRQQAHHSGTLPERHVRLAEIAGLARPGTCPAGRQLAQAGEGAVEAPVRRQGREIPGRHRLADRAALGRRLRHGARGDGRFQPSSTLPAAARRAGSRPATTASTAQPLSPSAAHSAARCSPHVRTPVSVTSSA